MKIIVPVDEKSLDSNVCISFGRAPYFLVYETRTEKAEFYENQAAHSKGGAGIKAAQTIVDLNASVLLTPRCGENAVDIINKSNIEIYKSYIGTAKDNISSFIRSELEELKEVHKGLHSHG